MIKYTTKHMANVKVCIKFAAMFVVTSWQICNKLAIGQTKKDNKREDKGSP